MSDEINPVIFEYLRLEHTFREQVLAVARELEAIAAAVQRTADELREAVT